MRTSPLLPPAPPPAPPRLPLLALGPAAAPPPLLPLARRPARPKHVPQCQPGDHVNGGCCFDYGNAETDNLDDGKGTMEALYFGTSKGWGHGQGPGPWVMADVRRITASPRPRPAD